MTPLPRRSLLAAALACAAAPVFAQAPRGGRIVASFSILADLVREVAPLDFEVGSLVGADADAHAWEPRPGDVRKLAGADLVVVNGLGFEGWMTRLVKNSGYRGEIVVASAGITPRHAAHDDHDHDHGHGHDHGDADPHAWQDLAHAQRYVATIAAALARRWPQRRAEFEARAAAYGERLAVLDTRLRRLVDTVPREQRRVITSHDAFGYLGAAYGIEFLAPQGWTTHSEPSAAAVGRLVRQIRQQKVRAVFVENISDPRLVERIARETGARLGGRLYSDALSAPGGPAASFVALYEYNVRALVAGMSGA
ncbi:MULTISPECIES: metal ABC transporter solute-binding protein, Zn/Mn family [unclassified Rubrivivax]|uniref:metal ABC transporter solute-binding protein, Zn/Mn family n=1 Tax=unclassified Rubrivivax TaxID=2649762 RepID=UPI001E359549|nr:MULTISPECIES: zinc ABC transporter substrate-binding protein [unclassified Rubrivivax]MCC9598399.1 zinc ABC transporter substrate-binding protein [Rubrivivax sp. JA1055]MCC9648099.1 zinc ABC transporter substrate-binding protein [Rubrivivax sp. JA1029]